MELKEIHACMHNRKLYFANQELVDEQLKCLDNLYEYNNTRPSEQELRKELLNKMFSGIGENCYIEPPLHANWGGKHVHIGNNFYANFNLTLVDDTHIYIGDNVMVAPNVVICTGTHPIYPDDRKKGGQFNAEIHIGNNVWIGANSVIMPGVTIGDNSVIGAMSLVTKDIPANVVAFGTPCRVIRKITEDDKKDCF